MTGESDAPNWSLETWSLSKDLDSEENTRFKTDGRTKCIKCWNPATAAPLSSDLGKKMVLVESGLFIGNHLLPFRTKILEEDNPTPPVELVELDDSNQTGTIKDPVQEDSGDSSEDDIDHVNVSSGGDNSVSTRTWTRSQGPPPVLVGTQSLSKCSLNVTLTLLPKQGGVTVAKPKGLGGKLLGWANSLWGWAPPMIKFEKTTFVSVL